MLAILYLGVLGGLAPVHSLSAILATVPPVLDGVVAAAVQSSGNLCPPLALLLDHALDESALLCRDGIMIQSWLQVLMVSLPALLGSPCGQETGDPDPVQRTLCLNELHQVLVLLLGPRPPSVAVGHDEILDVCAVCLVDFVG